MKLAEIKNVEIFAAGTYHKGTPEEVTFTDQDLEDMVRNWRTLSSGDRPKHKPFLKIGKVDPHKGDVITFEDGNPSAGTPTNVRKKGSVLLADMVDVQPAVARWVELKVFSNVSAEIDKPPQGETHPEFGVKGPVLKAVSLLGANPPAVKGLKPVGMAATKTKITHHCFAEVKPMDRKAALDFLTQQGVDVSTITDAVPDEFLIGIATAWQTAMAADPNKPAGMSANPPVVPPMLPTSITAKFSEMFGTFTKQLEGITAKIKANDDLATQQGGVAKKLFVHSFCEQALKDRLLSPAEVECDAKGEPLPHTELAAMLRADHTKQHVFGEGAGQTKKTELELHMDRIKLRKPHTFSERVVSGGKPDLYSKIRADVAAAMVTRAARTGKTLHEKLHLRESAGVR